MEFSADDVDADAFFPISVSFTATGTLCGIQVRVGDAMMMMM